MFCYKFVVQTYGPQNFFGSIFLENLKTTNNLSPPLFSEQFFFKFLGNVCYIKEKNFIYEF